MIKETYNPEDFDAEFYAILYGLTAPGPMDDDPDFWVDGTYVYRKETP